MWRTAQFDNIVMKVMNVSIKMETTERERKTPEDVLMWRCMVM